MKKTIVLFCLLASLSTPALSKDLTAYANEALLEVQKRVRETYDWLRESVFHIKKTEAKKSVIIQKAITQVDSKKVQDLQKQSSDVIKKAEAPAEAQKAITEATQAVQDTNKASKDLAHLDVKTQAKILAQNLK